MNMHSQKSLKITIINLFVYLTTFCIGIILTNCYVDFSKFQIGEIEVEPLMQNVSDYVPVNPPPSKPNPLLLLVTTDNKKNIFLNHEKIGSINHLKRLEKKLLEVFNDRNKLGVYEDGTNKILKRVIVQPQRTLKGRDLYVLVDAIKKGGAKPILIDWKNEINEFSGGSGG